MFKRSVDRMSIINILHFVNNGLSGTLPLFLPFIAEELHINFVDVGIIGGAYRLSLLGSLVCLSFFAGSCGISLLFRAALIYLIGYFVLFCSYNFSSVLMAFIIAGLGFGVFHTVSYTLICIWCPSSGRGAALGNFSAIGESGRIVFSSVVAYLIVVYDWKFTAFTYLLVAALIVSIAYYFFNSLLCTSNGVVIRRQGGFRGKGFSIFHPKIIFVIVAAGFDAAANSALIFYLPFILLHKGIEASYLGLISAGFFFGNLLGKIVFGRLVDKYQVEYVFMFCETLMLLLAVLLICLNNFVGIVMVSILLGTVSRGTAPVNASMLAESVRGDDELEVMFGIRGIVSQLLSSLTFPALGLLSERYGLYASMWGILLFVMLAIITIGVKLIWDWRCPRKQQLSLTGLRRA